MAPLVNVSYKKETSRDREKIFLEFAYFLHSPEIWNDKEKVPQRRRSYCEKLYSQARFIVCFQTDLLKNSHYQFIHKNFLHIKAVEYFAEFLLICNLYGCSQFSMITHRFFRTIVKKYSCPPKSKSVQVQRIGRRLCLFNELARRMETRVLVNIQMHPPPRCMYKTFFFFF